MKVIKDLGRVHDATLINIHRLANGKFMIIVWSLYEAILVVVNVKSMTAVRAIIAKYGHEPVVKIK